MNNLSLHQNQRILQNSSFDSTDLFLIFKLNDSKYAVSADCVLEVMKLPYLEYPQKLPNNYIGLLKYNNIMINILDLRFYLNVPIQKYDENHELIIIKTDESIFGIITEKITDTKNIKPFSTEIIQNPLGPVDKIYCEENISIVNLYRLEKILQDGTDESTINVQELFPKEKSALEIMKRREKALSEKSNFDLVKNILANDKYILFAIDDSILSVNITYVREVLKNKKITNVPCAKNYIHGLIGLHGDFIPIIDLQNFVEGTTHVPPDNAIIIVESENVRIGFAVDKIFEIFEFSEDEIESHKVPKKYVYSEIIHEGKLIYVLNMKALLQDERLFT